MNEFLKNLDPASVGFGVVLSYVIGFIVSLMNLIYSRIELNNWMIRVKRHELGIKDSESFLTRIKKRFCRK